MSSNRRGRQREKIQEKLDNLITSKKRDIVKFLQQLIQVRSITQSGEPEKRIQELIAKRLERIGCSVDIWTPKIAELKAHPAFVPIEKDYTNRPIVVGTLKGRGQGRSLILNGHVDVVPPGPSSDWKYDPWDGTIQGERIYGRGAADMKGGLTSLIMALEVIVESGINLKGDVIVESVLDEEIGGNGTLACILKGYRADGAIITEPTDLELHPAHRGGRFFKLTIEGKSAHVGFKFEGVDALDKAIKVIMVIKELEKQRNKKANKPLFKRYPIKVPILIGMINGGEWPATVPDKIVLKGTVECLPGEDIKDVSRDFGDHIHKVADSDPWMRSHQPRIDWSSLSIEASEINLEHPLVRMMDETFREVTGRPLRYSGFPGGCDMRLLVNYGSTPTIIFGPGSLKQAHAANESISINDLLLSTTVISRFLTNWGHK